MSPRVERGRRFVAMTGLIAAFMVHASACGNDGADLPPPASPPIGGVVASSASTPTLDARDAEAWEEIQAKFDGFMETWIKWSAQGTPGGFEDPATAELHEYAAAFLWDEAVAELAQQARDGQRQTGRPDWRDVGLLKLDWEADVPEATFEVCVDDSEWLVVDGETGDPVPAEPGGPSLWTVTARWAGNPEFGPVGWALTSREVDESQPC